MQEAQRRDYYRLEASSTPDWVRVLNKRDVVVEALEAQILDVSATGVRLLVRAGSIVRGTRLAVRFRIGSNRFAARGEVVWSELSEFSKTLLVGVRFDVDEHTRQRLVRAIFDEQRDQLRRRAPH